MSKARLPKVFPLFLVSSLDYSVSAIHVKSKANWCQCQNSMNVSSCWVWTWIYPRQLWYEHRRSIVQAIWRVSVLCNKYCWQSDKQGVSNGKKERALNNVDDVPNTNLYHEFLQPEHSNSSESKVYLYLLLKVSWNEWSPGNALPSWFCSAM